MPTVRLHAACWNPSVVRHAAAVLERIVPEGISPFSGDELALRATTILGGRYIEVVNANTGFDPQANGIGIHLHSGNGIVFLLFPDYKERDGWQGPPQVVLDGTATAADAVFMLDALAKGLDFNQ
jgi:hypothetical protein